MAGIMDGVDARTQMVGANRLELLLFHLGEKQRYGINVFKVQEVIQCPQLTNMPNSASAVRGIVNMRGKTISIIDLGMAMGKMPVADPSQGYVIVTEFNRKVQGMLVNGVDRILNMNWKDIMPPPEGMGKNTYMTAVTKVDNELIEIIDVEKVLSEIVGQNTEVSSEVLAQRNSEEGGKYHVLVVDDSSVARNQVKRTLEQLGIEVILCNDGAEALTKLKAMVLEHNSVTKAISMIISDVEMPEMDGYTLTAEIRKDPMLRDVYIALHTSLSGVFNKSMVEKVGADQFLPKFHPDELAEMVLEALKDERVHPIVELTSN